MRGRIGLLNPRRALFGLLLLTAGLLLPRAWADEPVLTIRLAGGESAVYAVGEIQRIGFEGEDTLVVVTVSGPDNYTTRSIERIEFLWGFSSVDDPEDAAVLLEAVHLFQNQPNPFSLQTRISFDLLQAGEVDLSIYSPDGRHVRTLVTGKHPAGPHAVCWDGLDDAGRAASSGVYFYSLRAPGLEESRHMILLP